MSMKGKANGNSSWITFYKYKTGRLVTSTFHGILKKYHAMT